jgi:DNA-binding NtrC family response regulator
VEKKTVIGFTEQALDALMNHNWPGNVRQLENAIRRGVLLANDLIDVGHLALSAEQNAAAESSGQMVIAGEMTVFKRAEREAIMAMLEQTGGNKLETAKRLGIGRQTLYTKIKAYGIEL